MGGRAVKPARVHLIGNGQSGEARRGKGGKATLYPKGGRGNISHCIYLLAKLQPNWDGFYLDLL